MAFSLWNLLKFCVLIMNALALLHPHRFLKNCEYFSPSWEAKHNGSSPQELQPLAMSLPAVSSDVSHRLVFLFGFRGVADGLDKVQEGTGIKQQIAGMLHAARFMRCESYSDQDILCQ
jgi:Yos1-like